MNAIGFGNINSKRELKNILTQVRTSFTQHDLIAQGTIKELLGKAPSQTSSCTTEQ